MELWRTRLKTAIDDRRLPYKALSENAGFNGEYVSKMLNGRINPTVDKVLRICEVADIDPSFLFVSESASSDTLSAVEKASKLPEAEASLVARLLESARKE